VEPSWRGAQLNKSTVRANNVKNNEVTGKRLGNTFHKKPLHDMDKLKVK
jgi:hypothetical protein